MMGQKFLALTMAALFTIGLTSCGMEGTPLSILAGSELKDLKPLVPEIERCANVSMQFKYTGTLDGVETIAGGEKYDVAWFSHGKYMSMLDATRAKIVTQDKIMLSPVILGVKASKAKQWGWDKRDDLTWNDIAEKATTGELKYAMTNPSSSNTGFTTTVGVAAAFAGATDQFDVSKLDINKMKDFFKGQALTAGSSGWLRDAYVREQNRLDGIINYESVLLQLNRSGQLHEQLFLVYPQEGIITADYPIMLLNASKRENFDKLVACLRAPEMQRKIMENTSRRPVIPQVKPDAQFPNRLLVELPFPRTSDEIDMLLFTYLDELSRPSYTVFVLDTSGSMGGERIQRLRQALQGLTGADTSLTGQFARFRQRETVVMLPFSSAPKAPTVFNVKKTGAQSGEMTAVRNYVGDLEAKGGTAIYDSLAAAFQLVNKGIKEDPDRFFSIVLLTDGENSGGMSFGQFQNRYRYIAGDAANVKIFPILFGDSNEREMIQLANLAGGRVFDGNKHSLNFVFKKIRGYQ